MFAGLSAFPLTPLDETGAIDEPAFERLVARLARAGVDSIGALGSTGSYAYLDRAARARAARLAVGAADGVPVMIGIGAVRTEHVIALAHDAQDAGAAAVMLAPVSYQPLTEDEVHGLYADVTAELSVPLCVYDNPGTTHFAFSDDLHASVAALPNVQAIKLPGDGAQERIGALRTRVDDDVAIGVSGDPVRRRRVERRRRRLVQRDRRAVPGRRARDRARSARRPRRGSSRCGRCSAATAACGSWRPRRRCSGSPASATSRARCARSTVTRAPRSRTRCGRWN